MEKQKTTQEMLDEYMTMAEYYEAERSRLQSEIGALSDKSKGQQKKIEELEAEARKKGLLKSPSEEEQKVKTKKSEVIEKLEMAPTGTTTFLYIADNKNPPVGKSDKVYIVGELTRGRLVEMKPTQKPSEYAANLIVEPGYKYTFCFKVGDIMTIDAHYPTYLTKVGRYVNYVYVIDPRRKAPPRATTFIDKSMHHIERKRLEELYNKVVSAGELPLLKELAKHVGRLYYAVDTPYGIFRLMSVSVDQASVIIRRLTDQHFIPLDSHNVLQESKPYGEFMKEFIEIPPEETSDRLEELQKKRLTVLYQSFGPSEYSLIGSRPDVPLEDYVVEFNYTNGTINNVRNIPFGAIDWGAEQVDNEYAFLTVTPIEIFGQEIDPQVYNLIHMHISSLGESATVDIKYMKKFEEPDKYYKFEKDVTGKTLKYRLLVQNGAVRTILYNFRGKIRELECIERKYKVGEIVNIKSLSIPDTTYAQVVSIPVQTLASLNPEKLEQLERSAPQYEIAGGCKSRYFEELQGYVDIELIPDMEEKPIKQKRLSVPICECKRGIEEHKKGLAIIKKWRDKVTERCMELIKQTKERTDLFNTKGNELATQEKKDVLEQLQKLEGELLTLSEDDLNGVEMGVIKEILKESGVVQRKLALDIRMAKMTS